MEEQIKTNRTFKDFLTLYLKGMGMGVADLIPGISGGTIAFITGIYEELIESIRSIDIVFFNYLIKFKIKDALAYFRWPFLMAVLTGILTSILILSKLVEWLSDNYPVLLNAFFFGLILATIPIIFRIVQKWSWHKIILVIISTLGMYYLVNLTPVTTPQSLPFIFICGALAISAMILPGISGAFILILLGKYHFMIQSINNRDLLVIAVFGFGIFCGILVFVRVLAWLFNRYHDQTIAVLTGVVIGSLNKIWPWKHTVETIVGRHGELLPIKQSNYLPTDINTQVVLAIILACSGFIVALMLDSKDKKKISLR